MFTQLRSLNDMLPRRFVFRGLCLFITAVLLGGCAGTYGKLHWDPQLTTAFQNHDIQKDFNYYYYGVGNRTFAIAGISPDYNFKSRMWREAPQDTEEFNVLISRAWENYFYKPYDPQGAQILDPEGKQVGVWYSSLRYVTVKFSENNRIVLIPDTPFLGGPEADAGNDESHRRISRVEPNPYISYSFQALMTRR